MSEIELYLTLVSLTTPLSTGTKIIVYFIKSYKKDALSDDKVIR